MAKRTDSSDDHTDERIAAVFESFGQPFFAVDRNGRFICVNRPAAAMLHGSSGPLNGRSLWAEFPDLVDRDIVRKIRRAAEEGREALFRVRSPALQRWIEASVCPGLGGATVYFRDASGLEAADEELARLAAIVESSHDAIIGKTLDGVILSWNAAAERLYGYAAESAIGRPISIIVPPEELETVQRCAARVRSGEGIVALETARLRKDGTRIPVSLTVSPVKDRSGVVVAASMIERDITERRLAERALAESERRFRSLLDTLPQLVWTCRPDGGCDYLSRQWREHTGASERQPPERDWLDALHPEDRPQLQARWSAAVAGQDDLHADIRLRGRDGAYRWFKTRAVPMRGEDGAIVRWFGSSTDISEIVEARAEAERANAAKSRFIAAASHDLRQPVQAARIYLDLLARQLRDPEQTRLADDTRQALQASENLLNALLDVSTLESGGIEPEIQDLPVQEILDALVHESRPQAESKGLDLRVVRSAAIVRSDPALLRRMLRNLLQNAIRYTRQGRVLVGCRRFRGTLRIEVWDTGTGIPREQLGTIFEDLRQLGNPERNRAQGIGLGLSVVQRMARLLGHEVSVRSWPNRGSGFAIAVPMAAAGAEPVRLDPPPAGAAADSPSRHGVLVIEDDEIQLMGLGMLLESWGYRVVAARDGEKALAAVQSAGEPPDLVLSDLRLPGALTGIEAITRIRAVVRRDIPGILLTGDTDPKRLREARGSDLVLLHKPFDPGSLGNIIADLLDTRLTASRRDPASSAAR